MPAPLTCPECHGSGWRGLIIEETRDEAAGVATLELRDTHPLPEQRASWSRLRAMIAGWNELAQKHKQRAA